MKKGLVVVIALVVSFSMFSSVALAAITTSGSVQWKISGSDEKPGGAKVASPLFKYGDVRMHYDVKLTSGPWEALFAPRVRLDKDPEIVEDNGSYLKVYLDSSSVMLKPRLDYGVFDVYSVVADGAANIPKKPGVKVNVPFKPLDMTLDLVLNSSEVFKNTGGENTAGSGDKEAKWNYGAGLSFSVEPISVALQFVTTDVTDATWYGSAYGAKLGVDLAPLSITAEFASYSPEAAGEKDGSGIYGKLGYALEEGLGDLALVYKGSDKNFNGCGTATADDYSKIEGTYTYPLAEAVNMSFTVASVDKGQGDPDFTEYSLKFAASL
ncbi:MAG: porin [bacterium]